MSCVKRIVSRWWGLGPLVLVGLLWIGCQTPRRAGLRPLQLSPGLLQQRLQQLIDSTNRDGGSQVGLYVQDSATEQILVQIAGKQRMTPASVAKLVTGIAGLAILGPQDRFLTQLLVDKQQDDGKSVGDLYFRGSGDPSLQISHLQHMVEMLQLRGVKAIERDIVVDASIFDHTDYGPGWMWDDLTTTFSPPITGLNIQHNLATIRFATARSKEPIVPYVADALGQLLHLKSLVRWANVAGGNNGNGGHELRWTLEGTSPILPVPMGARVRLEGSLMPNREGNPEVLTIPLQDPALFAGQLLKELLIASGISVAGLVRLGQVPEGPHLVLASHASAPLTSQLTGWMKASDNFGMECLLKRIGAATSGGQGSFQSGLMAIRRFLQQEVGLTHQTMLIADGSGVSRYSQVSPKQLVMLLQYAISHFAIGPELLVALPSAGLDGTLYGRMQRTPWLGRIRAKTGTMRGTSSLAGYLATESGHLLIFAVMAEGFVGSAAPFRQLQEQILAELLPL